VLLKKHVVVRHALHYQVSQLFVLLGQGLALLDQDHVQVFYCFYKLFPRHPAFAAFGLDTGLSSPALISQGAVCLSSGNPGAHS
jgi:hypothetical protein